MEPGLVQGGDRRELAVVAPREDDRVAAALRDVATPPGEVVRPGEWAKAKKLLSEGKDVNYEGASGNVDFDENGDVGGLFGLNVVDDSGKWSKTLLR